MTLIEPSFLKEGRLKSFYSAICIPHLVYF